MYSNPRNHGVLIGRIGWDIRLEKVGTIDKTTLRLGVGRSYKDKKSGKYETDWVSVTALAESAALVAKVLKKGDLVAVEYAIKTNEYKNAEGKARTGMDLMLVNFSKVVGGADAPATTEDAPEAMAAETGASTEELPF